MTQGVLTMEEEIMRQNAKTAAKPLFDYNVP
jgi:hypothetical protein